VRATGGGPGQELPSPPVAITELPDGSKHGEKQRHSATSYHRGVNRNREGERNVSHSSAWLSSAFAGVVLLCSSPAPPVRRVRLRAGVFCQVRDMLMALFLID
jgi:hypothetical protein